jgi:hypothetical protein
VLLLVLENSSYPAVIPTEQNNCRRIMPSFGGRSPADRARARRRARSANCRVEIWRGGAKAPFPDPAHQTGRADFPYCSSVRSASKIASSTMTAAICPTRSLMVGTDHSNCTLAQFLFRMGADYPSVSSAQRTALGHSQDQKDGRTGRLESLRR